MTYFRLPNSQRNFLESSCYISINVRSCQIQCRDLLFAAVIKRMKPAPLGLPLSEILLPLLGLSKSFNLCLMKSIVSISSTATTIFIFLPHEKVDGSLVPTLFKDRPPDYHMFLISTLSAFLGAFSSMMIQHKERVERFCRIYAIASMLVAIAIVFCAAAL